MQILRYLIVIMLLMGSVTIVNAGSTLLKSHGNGVGTLSWNSASSALYDEDDLKIDINKNFVTYRIRNSNGNWRQIKYTVNNPSNKEIRNDKKKMIWDNAVNGESITYEVVPYGIKLFINGNKRPLSNQWSFGYNTQGNIRWEEIENVGFVAYDEITGEYLWTILYPTMKDGDDRNIPLIFTRTSNTITITAPDLYTAGYNFTSWELDPSTQSGNTILIYDCQDLVCVSNSIANNTALKTVAAGEWVLNANLHNNLTTNTFYINSSNVTWLKINATSNVVNWFQTNGITIINNTKITSWNETTSDTVNSGNRGYIYASGSSSKMNISNSNVSYLGYSTSNAYGITYSSLSSGSNITNNTLLNSFHGIYLSSLSSSNIIINNTITISGISGYGIYVPSSNNNIINNTITTSGTNGYGIYAAGSNNNIINNTITTSGSGGYGIRLQANSNNYITNGSIIAQQATTASYYLQLSSGTNNFINTNFTTRRVQFTDTTSRFNYSNNYGLTFVNSNISASNTMIRNISNWNQTNLTWSDNVASGTITAYYNITGLLPSSLYSVYNQSSLSYTLVTDSNGMLPNFSINHDTSNRVINVTAVNYTMELQQPLNTSTGVLTPVTLYWRQWPTVTPHTYQVSTDYQFLNIVVSGTATSTTENFSSGAIALSNSTTYYWRARNSTGSWSGIFEFTTASTPATPGQINATVFDEQNYTVITNFTAQLYNSTTVLMKSTTTGWANFSSAEVSSGQYLLRIVPNSSYASRNILVTSPTNATVYLPSTTNTINTIAFYLIDYTTLYPWTSSILTITKNSSVMHSSYFDADDKVAAYLIQGDSYGITITNGNNIHNWGNYIAVASGNVEVVITDIAVNATAAQPFTYNLSHSTSDITLTWTSNHALTYLNFTILRNNSVLVHQLNTTIGSGLSQYIVTDLNSLYYVYLDVEGSRYITNEVINYRAGYLRTDCGLGLGCVIGWGSGESRFELPLWAYHGIAVLLIWIIAGSFGALFASFGAVLALVFTGLFAFWGWLEGLNIGLALIGAITVIAIADYLRSKE